MACQMWQKYQMQNFKFKWNFDSVSTISSTQSFKSTKVATTQFQKFKGPVNSKFQNFKGPVNSKFQKYKGPVNSKFQKYKGHEFQKVKGRANSKFQKNHYKSRVSKVKRLCFLIVSKVQRS